MTKVHTSIAERQLYAESEQLWNAMRKCKSEDEFQILQERHNQISEKLKLRKRKFPSLSEFQDHYNSSDLKIASSSANLTDKASNLQSLSWYLGRISKKVEEIDPKAAREFHDIADSAMHDIDDAISDLKALK